MKQLNVQKGNVISVVICRNVTSPDKTFCNSYIQQIQLASELTLQQLITAVKYS